VQLTISRHGDSRQGVGRTLLLVLEASVTRCVSVCADKFADEPLPSDGSAKMMLIFSAVWGDDEHAAEDPFFLALHGKKFMTLSLEEIEQISEEEQSRYGDHPEQASGDC